MKRKLYLSPIGIIISWILSCLAFWHKPFMVYGHYNRKQKKFKKLTRISSSAKLQHRSKIDIDNNVWIGHYCILDGIGGIKIGEGVNIASHSCIYSHSSHNSIRLLGAEYIKIPDEQRPGYILKKVTIGDYTFIGTSCIILSGVTIGKGCIIGAGSIVNKDIPDFAVVSGNPAKIIGDTQIMDKKLLREFQCNDTYYLNSLKNFNSAYKH